MTKSEEGEAIARAVEILRRGGVIAAPTETLIGLLADARSAEAIEAILALKGRSEAQTIGLIAPDLESVSALIRSFDASARALAERHWPGPLTLVFEAAPGLHPALVQDGGVAIRIPRESPALRLARAFGGPLTATSANLAGLPAVASTRELDLAIRQGVDLVHEGDSPGGAPSTIVRIQGDRLEILREGAIPADVLTSRPPSR